MKFRSLHSSTSTILKRSFLAAIMLLAFFYNNAVSAQTLVTIGTAASTSSTSGPASSTTAGDRNERHMTIYSAAELSAAGITAGRSLLSIAWEKTGVAHYYNKNLTFRVWLKHSAATTFPASPNFATETSTATMVYQSTADSIPTATGWINFTFNTATPSFTWDGVQNLQVITEMIRPTDWTEIGFLWRTIASVTNAAANANGTMAAPPATLTRTGTRPQIRLGITTTGNDAALIGMPNPVSASAGVQNIDVRLRNTGTILLANATISFTVNGGAPVNFPWTGSLAPGAIATVTIGSNNFAGGPNSIVATVSNPNGAADADPTNNVVTKNIIICSPLSGAYTINQGAATGGTNFNNFNDFSSYLTSCGVSGNVTATVTPGSGPYVEQVVFQNIPGIGAGATVRIEGNGQTMTTSAPIIQTGANPNRHLIRLIGLQYFTVNNLRFDMFTGSTGFIAVHVLNSGNNITLSNNVVNMGAATSTLLGAFVANGDPSGILTPGGTFDNITITGNTSTGGGYGASVNGLVSPLATNVVIANNTFNNFNSNGVYLRETNGAHVNNNIFDKAAGTVSVATAIQLAQAANINGRVYNNRITMTQTTGSFVGINLFNGTGHRVYNNLIYDIRSTTGDIEGIRVRTGGTNPEIYFNTVSIDNPNASTGDLVGFREELSNTGSILRNNIFSISQPTTGLKHAIGIGTLTVPTAINSNYNDFWVPGGNIAYRGTSVTYPVALVIPTLAAWQAASGQDAASFDVDPFFQSVTNPIPTSAVINNQALAGTGITTDITGATRGAAPDPGAYEFAPPTADASISNYILPTIPYCAANLDVRFELTNVGADPLNSVVINWTVNGVPQPAVNWAGPTLASGASTIVTLGNIPIAPNTFYDFSATSSLPNGGLDINPANDNYTFTGFRQAFAGTVTINAAAASSPTNYQGFQSMANALSQYGLCSAVIINVLNGAYTEQVVFNTIPGSSAVNTVTLNGNGQTLQYNPTVAAQDHILQLNAVTHMIVENLTVNSLHATQGRGIHITNGASKLVIRNNTVNVSVTNSTSICFGIIISGQNWLLDGSQTDSVIISGNTVTGGYSSIQLSGIHWTNPLTRIQVLNNTVLDWYGFGIYLSYTNNALVRANTIRRPTRTNSGSDAVTPAGITVPAGSLGFILEKNRMYDFHVNMPGTPAISRGFYVSGTPTAPTSGTIQNNLVYGMTNDGAQYGIQDNSQTGPINIYHNTIVLNSANGASTSNTNAINMSAFSTQTGTDIRNNVFVVTRGGTGVKRIFDVSTASSTFVSNYNVTWLNAPGGTQTYGQIGSTTYNSFADWQTSVHDLNSSFVDPAFVNPATGNFTPTAFFADGTFMGTSAVGTVVDDILGTVRGVNPDPGAFEFIPPPCSVVNGGLASTTATPFCSSGTATITATGFSIGSGSSYQWQYSNDNFVTNINDLAGQTNPSSMSTGTITSTTWYRLRVVCASGPATAYSNIIRIQVDQPVVITTHPLSQSSCIGSNVSFTVVANNATSYQWRKGAVNIGGATSSTYTITGATAADAGSYDVVVTNTCGSVTSNPAILTLSISGSWIGVTSTNWNTASNWCGGIPTPGTDVIIPSSAPFMPNLSVSNGTARNISIAAGGSLTVGVGGILEIYGNLVNNGTFNPSAGDLVFRGATSQSASPFTALNVIMNGAGGLVLGGNTSVTGNLLFSNGNISLGSFNLSLAGTSLGSVNSHIVMNGTGNVIATNLAALNLRTIPVGINSTSYNPVTFAANTGHVTDNFTINVKQGVFVNGVSGATYSTNVVDRTWNITEGTAGGSNVNISMQWNLAQELPGFQRNRAYGMRHNGTTWVLGPNNGSTGTDPYTKTLENVTAFSPFAVGSEALIEPKTGIFPNPANREINVVLNMPANSPVVFAIYDSKGRLMMRTTGAVVAGLSRTTLNIERFSAGVYVLKVSTPDNTKFLSERFVKIH
jgi:Right handed beta helix region/Secretion system C-terminal sorting domain